MSVSLPTDRRDARLVARALREVLSGPAYAALAAVTAVLALSTFVIAQNVPLFLDVIVGGGLPLWTRLELLVSLYPFVGPAFDALTGAMMILAAGLVGVNVAMLTYHLRRRRVTVRSSTGSFAGVVLGTLGAGCAACGTVLLSGLLSLFGAAGALALLPLEGAEFSLLALGTLALSIYWLADGMRGAVGAACPVEYESP